MKLQFKQGLIRIQTDTNNNPTFLQQSPSGISLIVSPDSTLITFSHKTSNYLFEENQTVIDAWPEPFQPIDQWLYWDIDIITGERTFGITNIKPVTSFNEPAGVLDRHWFDLQSKEMKVFTGVRYVTKLRVFAALLDDGGVLIPFQTGTQVGLNEENFAGMILFDEDTKPLKKFNRFGSGAFITTESPLSSQFSKLVNYKLENELQDGVSNEFIPKYSCLNFKNNNKLGLASYTDPDNPCIGISNEDINIGEAKTFIKNGFIKNDLWNWTEPTNTLLFVGLTGEITTTVPQSNSIQNIGYIVSPKSIFISIKQIIKLG